MQIVADTLGRPLTHSAVPEASARGAALLALRALGDIAALDDLPPAVARVTQPDAGRHAAHQAALAEQERLYGYLVT